MATLNEKLYAVSGSGTTSIEFFDANNPSAGWQLYSQTSFAVERKASSCVAIRTGMCFSLACARVSTMGSKLSQFQKIMNAGYFVIMIP